MATLGQTNQALANCVDALGEIKAKISELCEQEADLKQILIFADLPAIEGKLFRATVSHQQRTTLDPDKVKLFLTPEQIEACTRTSDCTVVKVSAKTRR